ncbi:MAG: riboflavin synthase [Acidobacteriota bacterium]|jgi:riboflavin synthase|nr:riboflavin synthase [Acidobacteriaceae bacterium]
MFTGIIEELGVVESFTPREAGARLRIGAATVLTDVFPGASLAVNGVCLTAVALEPGSFAADLAPETLERTNLGRLRPGDRVNLERPLSPTGRLGGHMVQGHVDGTGELLALEALGNGNWWLRIGVPAGFERYLVEKGSVAVDGISLTVARIGGGEMAITIIPHTYEHTTLGSRQPGWPVNLECDMLAKYVEKLLVARQG